jgi:hypothetical protein
VHANGFGAATLPIMEAATVLGLVIGFDAAASAADALRAAMRTTGSSNLDIEEIGSSVLCKMEIEARPRR